MSRPKSPQESNHTADKTSISVADVPHDTVEARSGTQRALKKGFSVSDLTRVCPKNTKFKLNSANIGVVEVMILHVLDKATVAKIRWITEAYTLSATMQRLYFDDPSPIFDVTLEGSDEEVEASIRNSTSEAIIRLPDYSSFDDSIAAAERELWDHSTILTKLLWKYGLAEPVLDVDPYLKEIIPANGNAIDWRTIAFTRLRRALLLVFSKKSTSMSLNHAASSEKPASALHEHSVVDIVRLKTTLSNSSLSLSSSSPISNRESVKDEVQREGSSPKIRKTRIGKTHESSEPRWQPILAETLSALSPTALPQHDSEHQQQRHLAQISTSPTSIINDGPSRLKHSASLPFLTTNLTSVSNRTDRKLLNLKHLSPNPISAEDGEFSPMFHDPMRYRSPSVTKARVSRQKDTVPLPATTPEEPKIVLNRAISSEWKREVLGLAELAFKTAGDLKYPSASPVVHRFGATSRPDRS